MEIESTNRMKMDTKMNFDWCAFWCWYQIVSHDMLLKIMLFASKSWGEMKRLIYTFNGTPPKKRHWLWWYIIIKIHDAHEKTTRSNRINKQSHCKLSTEAFIPITQSNEMRLTQATYKQQEFSYRGFVMNRIGKSTRLFSIVCLEMVPKIKEVTSFGDNSEQTFEMDIIIHMC